MTNKENKTDDLANSKSLENSEMKEINKSQNEMEEELKNEYTHILMNFYSHCSEKELDFNASIKNMLMCFKKADNLYISGKEVVWCHENSVKETYAFSFIKDALIRVDDKILEKNKFDKDDIYLHIKDFDVFQFAYDYVCELFKLNEQKTSM